jgi:RHS repeat-associated protein
MPGTNGTPLGQLASLTDAENQTTSYTYDARGLKLTETYPDHTGGSTVGQTGYGIVTFVYDNAGRVLRKQDQLGVTLTHSYDLAGRMTRRDYRTAANSPSGIIADSDTFTFDRASRMRTAVNGRYTNTVTYTFDPVGRKATEALTISARTYTTRQAYNARNELTTITYPDNTTSTRSYHATGALNQLRLDNATVSTRSYDAGRRQTSEALGNGITETRTYRADNLLSAINYSNTSLGNMTYTWDANKNKTSESITGVMSGYGFTAAGTTYDFEDRLTGFSRAATSGPALLSQSWNLTTVGDWTSVTTNGTAQNRTHGPTHELLTAGGQNVATDVKGNITTLPANLRPSGSTTAMNLNWDSDNKLRSADIDANGTADVNFQYDALGRRVARTGTGGSVVYVQMDQQTIADYPVGGAATTPTFRYVYGSYIDEPVVRKTAGTGGTLVYFHRNHQYSVTAITTSAGAISERYAYTAYGQPTILNASGTVISATTLSNRYSYTGREWDATPGLHHFRARWMSPSAGRFLGRDPIGYEGSEWGLYEYVASNVLVMTDPTGEIPIVCRCSRDAQNIWGTWEVVTDCTGLASTCCGRACCPGRGTGGVLGGPNTPCGYMDDWWVLNTPPPPTFPQVFCEIYFSCSASECRSDCFNQAAYLALALQARCAAICGRLPGPLQWECMRNCATDAGVFASSYLVGCLASCQLRCKNP